MSEEPEWLQNAKKRVSQMSQEEIDYINSLKDKSVEELYLLLGEELLQSEQEEIESIQHASDPRETETP
jgi:hypothetical protein